MFAARVRARNVAVGLAVSTLVVVATLSLRDGEARGASGRLAPLAPLVGGTWVETGDGEDRLQVEYEWTLGGEALRETAIEVETGRQVRETLFGWHPGRDEGTIAFQSWLADGEVREGILRADDSGLEMRVVAHGEDGSTLYHERIRFLGEDRLVLTVHRKLETEEILQREATFVRKRR